MKTAAIGVAAGLAMFVAGCTFPSKSRVVSQQQAGQMQRIEYGTIQKVNDVVIEGQRGPIGLYGGGATGVAATGGVGHGTGRDLAQVGGAVVGAVAGQAVEEVVTRQAAREMMIKLDNGSVVLVTQVSPPDFEVGERVAVANGAGGARVLAP
jgi:outer membrane lipoprotein SlyB